jgi:hypothetical protein
MPSTTGDRRRQFLLMAAFICVKDIRWCEALQSPGVLGAGILRLSARLNGNDDDLRHSNPNRRLSRHLNGDSTMTTTKSLMLAAMTALSLSAGAAMAQEGGSTYPVAPVARPAGTGLTQSGSSDVTTQAPTNWQNLPSFGGQG